MLVAEFKLPTSTVNSETFSDSRPSDTQLSVEGASDPPIFVIVQGSREGATESPTHASLRSLTGYTLVRKTTGDEEGEGSEMSEECTMKGQMLASSRRERIM